jgi:hypothetical protein
MERHLQAPPGSELHDVPDSLRQGAPLVRVELERTLVPRLAGVGGQYQHVRPGRGEEVGGSGRQRELLRQRVAVQHCGDEPAHQPQVVRAERLAERARLGG